MCDNVVNIMRILFQGDSITDAGRGRDDPHQLGSGYPKYAAEYIIKTFPDEEFEFINLGISGNRTCDLLTRWHTDCIDIQPDVVSILIGINDTWRRYDSNLPMSAEEYEANFRKLLEDIKANTHAKIMLLEPFLLSVDKDHYREDLNPKIDVARKLAREYADMFLPLDGIFAAASLYHETTYWSADGVHPTPAGADLIGNYYAQALKAMLAK